MTSAQPSLTEAIRGGEREREGERVNKRQIDACLHLGIRVARLECILFPFLLPTAETDPSTDPRTEQEALRSRDNGHSLKTKRRDRVALAQMRCELSI